MTRPYYIHAFRTAAGEPSDFPETFVREVAGRTSAGALEVAMSIAKLQEVRVQVSDDRGRPLAAFDADGEMEYLGF